MSETTLNVITRDYEVGRIVGGCFQPVPCADFGLSPRVLRLIADAVEVERRG